MPNASLNSVIEEDRDNRILVVDDEEMIRDMLAAILESEGYVVFCAQNGEQALHLIQSEHPSLVICDVRMPKMDGTAFVQQLRENHPDLSYIPVIFLSGGTDENAISSGLKNGADDYLTKPVDASHLLIKVEAILRQITRMKRKKRVDEVKLYKALVVKGKAASEQAVSLSAAGEMDPDKLAPAFREKLSEMCQSEGKESCSAVQLFSLSEYEDIFGEEWEKYAKKAMAIAEQTIRHHLRAGDEYSPNGENGFLLLFPKLDEQACKARIDMIADEIRVNLLGEEARVYRSMSLDATTVALEDFCDSQGNMTAESLNRAFGGRMGHAVRERAPDPSLSITERVLSQIEVRFQPVWEATSQKVFAYECLPYRRTVYGVFTGAEVLHGGEGDPLTVELDIHMAKAAAKAIEGTSEGEYGAQVFLPLHFTTLFGAGRECLEEILGPVKGRSRELLYFEVISVPSATSPVRVWDAMRFLKEFSKSISVELPVLDRNVPVFSSAGAMALKLSLKGLSNQAEMGQFTADLKRHVDEIGKQKMLTFLSEVDTINSFKASLAAGSGYVSGRVVGPISERARQSFSLPEKKILFG
ncbi:response regulator transcription factor [Aestuariispira insulae]|uniref:Response regulator receiver domain-containing protein n=1 Tax=Aestuariispira insulae TaxID=1461337 RepID=A0A3D9HRX7_9PROT|nr:response regulator [Aestuariispira insulae]RED51616.1 response regulator receiver domain-containing protein [Aestuariispira insulae]